MDRFFSSGAALSANYCYGFDGLVELIEPDEA
jgi:hypothetical protein